MPTNKNKNNPDLEIELREELDQAENSEAMAEALQRWAESVQKDIINESRGLVLAEMDATALAQRGIRQLTQEERKFYQVFANAARSSNFKQALTELDVVMPKTVIESVFEDLQREHPLLSFVDFQNTEGAIEFIYNADGVELATWSPLCAKIVEELSSSFKKADMRAKKLSAFIPVCKAMLDLGPEWLDRYVRTILTEAVYEGLEKGIVVGTGKDEPMGMIRDLSSSLEDKPEKKAIKMPDFTPESYAKVIAAMAKSPVDNGRNRTVGEVALIVNPVDNLSKVFPATTFQRVDGSYTGNVFPYPTQVIECPYVPEGKAIMAMRGRYFFGLGTSQSGNIEFSDEYRFLEDERVYLTKLYGNGMPKDNNAFQLLDISALKPTYPKIETVSNTATP